KLLPPLPYQELRAVLIRGISNALAHFLSLMQSRNKAVKRYDTQNKNNNQITAKKNAYHLMQNTILFST
ncbi:hypothetical protein, partial [Anaerovibrio lipolyticus]|uniref:hypothetical protein n=1 Tax=Anaerovibrio lipolyticus TaxID=82374 RepID=UPI0023F1FEF5